MVLKNKKGLSAVIAAVILILLVMVVTGIVWTAITGLVRDETERTQTCFQVGLSDNVRINEEFTCYNTTNSTNKKVRFSIGIGDVEIESLLVSISADGSSKSFTLTNEETTISGLVNYPDGSNNIVLPQKNSGKTYIAEGFVASEVDSIRIAPTIDGNFCDVTDTIDQIDNCDILA